MNLAASSLRPAVTANTSAAAAVHHALPNLYSCLCFFLSFLVWLSLDLCCSTVRVSMYSGGTLCYSRSVALSLVALSAGIAVFALLRKRSSSSKPEDKRSKNICPFVDKVDNDGENEDIISQLPDEILIQVIGRLTARDAVRTSVLSKRWTDIYAFVHDVDFNCLCMFGLPDDGPCHWKGFCDFQGKFIDGLDTFFQRHCSYTKIRSIKLSWCFASHFPLKFNQWMRSAGRLGVEKLILNFKCNTKHRHFFFQLHLLSEVPSLEHLELHVCYMHIDLKIKCYSLKTLHFHEVNLDSGAIECILSNCLSLQTWVIHRCSCLFYPKLRIHGPNLQLEVLSVRDSDWEEIEFYASNLITFECSHNKMIKFSFDHVPKLQNFSANLCDEEEVVMPFLYSKLAKDLPQLSSLIFQTNGKCYQEMCLPSGVALFRNLRRLVLTFYDIFESNLFSLSLVLDMCPVLQEFHLVTKMTEFSGEQVNRRNVLSKSQLKKVEWSGFRGTDNEMSFAKYILKSVGTLEQMYININFQYYCGFGRWDVHRACKWSDDRREMMCEWLQRQAISKNARVIFRTAK